jgi:hypothetical protein
MTTISYSPVSSAGQLSADIAAADAASQAGAGKGTHYSITLASGGITLTEGADLSAINLKGADTLTINGEGGALSSILDPVAQRDHAAHPHPLLLGSGDLVPDPLELGKGQEHVQGQASHAGRGVERLGHRHEGDLVPVEQFNQLGEVGERAGQPIDC